MSNDNEKTQILFAYHPVMPDGKPCPALLTEQEAIKFLRLDTIGHQHPERTLKHYRDKKLLIATQIGKKLFYSLNELDSFIKRITEK